MMSPPVTGQRLRYITHDWTYDWEFSRHARAARESQAAAPQYPGPAACPPRRDWSQPGVEPTIDELMNDPVTHVIMRYDRITAEQVKAAVDQARRVITARKGSLPYDKTSVTWMTRVSRPPGDASLRLRSQEE